MNCECEHIIHEGSRHMDTVKATCTIKLIFGTFPLCDDCVNNCYDASDKEGDPVPLK